MITTLNTITAIMTFDCCLSMRMLAVAGWTEGAESRPCLEELLTYEKIALQHACQRFVRARSPGSKLTRNRRRQTGVATPGYSIAFLITAT
jgi:hypothetical protein